MHLIANWGFILLAIWLFAWAITTLLPVANKPVIVVLMALVAIAAGVLILIGR